MNVDTAYPSARPHIELEALLTPPHPHIELEAVLIPPHPPPHRTGSLINPPPPRPHHIELEAVLFAKTSVPPVLVSPVPRGRHSRHRPELRHGCQSLCLRSLPPRRVREDCPLSR